MAVVGFDYDVEDNFYRFYRFNNRINNLTEREDYDYHSNHVNNDDSEAVYYYYYLLLLFILITQGRICFRINWQ